MYIQSTNPMQFNPIQCNLIQSNLILWLGFSWVNGRDGIRIWIGRAGNFEKRKRKKEFMRILTSIDSILINIILTKKGTIIYDWFYTKFHTNLILNIQNQRVCYKNIFHFVANLILTIFIVKDVCFTVVVETRIVNTSRITL